jgi:hypothetical protein
MYLFFRIDDICLLINNFYPQEFTNHEKLRLKMELHHYEHNVVLTSEFQKFVKYFSIVPMASKD